MAFQFHTNLSEAIFCQPRRPVKCYFNPIISVSLHINKDFLGAIPQALKPENASMLYLGIDSLGLIANLR